MAVERFKKLRDAVVDKAGDAKDAVVDRAGDAKDAVADKVGGAKDAVVDKVGGAREAVTSRLSSDDPYAEMDPDDAAVARAEDARAARQAELDAKPMHGPAGAYLHGTVDGSGTSTVGSVAPPTLEEGATWRQRFAASREWAKQIEQQVQRERAQFAPPPPLHDWAARQQIADEERRIRDAFRAGYRSPEAWPVVITRFVVPAEDQLAGVGQALAASGLVARPDLVYGVTRVPDRLGGSRLGSDRDAVVEWEVVHASLDHLTPTGAPPDLAYFDATEPWVARAAGDPSVLDEDLALSFTATAGIPPEQILGIARVVTTDIHNAGDGVPSVRAVVRGVVVLHRSQTARSATEQFAGLRWMVLPSGPPPDLHVEVLNWAAVAQVVHRDPRELAEIPSRFGYLPSTPEELLTAYLEVVGIWPGDCCSAQVTRDRPGSMFTAAYDSVNGVDARVKGVPLPCADGIARHRMHGTTLVVVAYRDRPAYAEGRERWDRYQREVLQADLRLETGARRPVQDGLHPGVPRFLRPAARMVDTVDKVASWDDYLRSAEGVEFNPHRYCWPPTTGV